MASIFDIERRGDFATSFADFFSDLNMSVALLDRETVNLFEYLNYCIRYWPYRYGAIGLNEYLRDIDVDIAAPKGDRDRLLTLELIVNLLYWAIEMDKSDTGLSYYSETSELEEESDRLLDNAESILERCCNMRIREEDTEPFPRYYITRRNVTIDAAVLTAPELSDLLLGYYDIRNDDNLDARIEVLRSVYNYIEPHRKEYKGLSCGSISDEFFASMNRFGIRHNATSQIDLSSEMKKEVCDKLFLMAAYVIQTADVNKYRDELKSLRDIKVD